MSGDIEFGKCDICGEEKPLQREYYYYAIKCECCSPQHCEFVRHCNDCKPVKPKITTVTISTARYGSKRGGIVLPTGALGLT